MMRCFALTTLCWGISLSIYAADIYGFRLPGYDNELVREQVIHEPEFGGMERIRIFRTVVLERTAEATVAPDEVPGLVRAYFKDEGFHVWPGDPKRDGKILREGNAGGGRGPVTVDGVYYHVFIAAHFRVSPSADQVTLVIESTRTMRRDGAVVEFQDLEGRIGKVADDLGWVTRPIGLLAGGSPGSESWGETNAIYVLRRWLRPPPKQEEGCLYMGPSLNVEIILFPTEDEAQAWLDDLLVGWQPPQEPLVEEMIEETFENIPADDAGDQLKVAGDPAPVDEAIVPPVEVERPPLQPELNQGCKLCLLKIPNRKVLAGVMPLRIGRHVLVPNVGFLSMDHDLPAKVGEAWGRMFPPAVQ